MADTLNIDIYRGDTFDITIVISDENGDEMDLSARTFIAQVRPGPDHDTSYAFTVDTTNAADGELTLSMLPAVTATLPVMGVWDLQETNGGTVTTLINGYMNLIRDVSR